jgi:hypothetical protein
MQRVVSAILVTLSLALPVLSTVPARAIGVYEDAVGHAGFLFGQHRAGIRCAAVRTNDDERDASIFLISGTYPLRDNLLIQVEQPFISLVGESDIESGFGDLYLRARLRLAGGTGRALQAVGGLRVGSGTRRLYPYSSQSFDFELAVGYVDTLEILHVWALAGGGMVKREPEGLDEEDRHENFARMGGGLALPFGSNLYLRLGASGLVFRSGRARELYFAQLQYRYSPPLEIRLSAHAEAGEPDERVSDLALSVAILTHF